MLLLLFLLLLFAVVAALALFCFASGKPDTFRIERSTVIGAPPQKIFDIVHDFGRSKEWLPWDQLDPAMKRTISTPSSGVGASYAWDGNSKVGAGRQEIIETRPGELVRVMIDFERPMKARNTVDYIIEPHGSGAKLTWAMYGDFPLMSRVMDTVKSIDKMVGKDFEKGLANLKALAEKV
jgi:uncharacterized protein YndB with AHSA1/START domain